MGEHRGEEWRTKVGIIGTGLAGLCVAHHLSATQQLQAQFEVHLFEKGDCLGLDGNSFNVGDIRIDVPMRSVNPGE